MTMQLQEQDILKLIGDPKAISRELASFRRAARALSSRHPRMVDRYPEKWVGVYQGRVRAHGKTLEDVLAQVDKKNLPREQVIVRFIDKNRRTMIL